MSSNHLQNLCDINAKNDLMRTPLHMVAIEGHSRIIERLVGCGVELNSVDNDGNTPLHIVLIKKNAQPATVKTPQLIKVQMDLYLLFEMFMWFSFVASNSCILYTLYYVSVGKENHNYSDKHYNTE